MSLRAGLAVENGEAVPVSEVPELSNQEFRELVIEACRRERRVSALFADSRDGEGGRDLVELYAVLAEEDTASLLLARTRIEADVFESLTPDCPQVHLFEREIAEQYGCVPQGHPWLKPVRFQAPYQQPASGIAWPHSILRTYLNAENSDSRTLMLRSSGTPWQQIGGLPRPPFT
jgi:NADH:ubiquinone oxidoreductase subunit C